MTGPEHYREAERLAGIAKSDHYPAQVKEQAARVAQVHATMALVAATALLGPAVAADIIGPDLREWDKVAGVPASEGAGQ
ncbi:hypothetical protein [Planobispora rosea]|uniref:hypothetical protein n=1 Tax=Planobispora rosea TaxID=35762 RepID=UPI00083B8D8B|nr:hypothetical protein [Planobispora rosea]